MASTDAPAGQLGDPMLFKGVCYYLNDSLRKPVRAGLHDLLKSGGAVECPPCPEDGEGDDGDGDQFRASDGRPPRFDPRRLTHFITDSLDFREYDLIQALNGREPQQVDRKGKGKAREAHAGAINGTEDKVHIVTPAWVTRTYDLQTPQQPRFYSADKMLFFSGIVVCASEIPLTDQRDIFQAVVAFGGQSRLELTHEVTHLICGSGAGRKYEMALKYGTDRGMQVVLPKWFGESLKHSKLVPTAIYRFPDPPYATSLRDDSSGKPFADRLFEYWRSRLPGGPNAGSTSMPVGDTPPSVIPNTATYGILGYPDASGAIPDGGASRASDTQRYLRTAVDFASNKRRSQSAYPPAIEGAEGTDAMARDGDDLDGSRDTAAQRGFFADKRIYLASDLTLTFPIEEAFRVQISRHGGTCSSFQYGVDEFPTSEQEAEEAIRNKRASTTDGADAWEARRQAEKRLKESDIVIIHVREGWEYWTAYEAGISIGNLQYFYDCLRAQTVLSPLSRLGYYPVPSTEGLPDWPPGNHGGKPVMTVSNYAGEARDYVRTLIELLGGTFEGTMTKQTDYVVSACENGSKVSHAREWHIPLVTHLWLETLILDWRYVPPSADPSYLLSGSSAGGTHYAALLGDTPYTRDVIARWASRDEVRAERDEAMRPIEELEEAERADAPMQDVVNGADAGDGAVAIELDRAADEQEEEAPVQQRRPSLSPTIDRPPRPQSKAVESPAKPRSRTKTPMPAPTDREQDVEPVKQAAPVESAPTADARPTAVDAVKTTPAKGNGSKADGARRKRERSDSTLSSASSSSSSDNMPPSANKMNKAFAMISGENLLQGGSRRGAAAKAQAALIDQIKDRNAFEKELKSSGRKKGGVSRRSRSPSKKVTHDDEVKDEEMSEDEAAPDAPVIKAKAKAPAKSKAKARKQSMSDDDDDDDGVPEAEPPRKKPRTAKAAAPVSKQVKNLQASANGTTQDGGAVSSFDRPPNAKPAPVKPKKVKIISTGLGLDKDHADIKKMKTLGASWTDTSKDATHLVVKGISRTEKFLCSLPYAPKIVTQAWISACIAAGRLVDEMPYLLKDVKKEKEIGDTLENILKRAQQRKLFDNYNVYVTRQIQPDTSVMQRVISACGGTVHTKDLSKFVKRVAKDPTALVVSCEKDKREWQALAAAPNHKKIYSVEAVLQAVLHQDLERGFIEDHRIDARWEE